jgi:hypothetical protein
MDTSLLNFWANLICVEGLDLYEALSRKVIIDRGFGSEGTPGRRDKPSVRRAARLESLRTLSGNDGITVEALMIGVVAQRTVGGSALIDVARG